MDSNTIINDFIDGNLDPAGEAQFVLLFSNSEEFRADFKRSLTLERLMKTDSASLMPSSSATAGVFSALGFSPAGGVAFPAKTTGLWVTTQTFLRKYYQGIAGALTAAAITALLFILFDKDNTNSIVMRPDGFPVISSTENQATYPSMNTPQTSVSDNRTQTLANRNSSVFGNQNGNMNKGRQSGSISNKPELSQAPEVSASRENSSFKETYQQYDDKIYEAGTVRVVNVYAPGNSTYEIVTKPVYTNVTVEEREIIGLSVNLFGSNYMSLQNADYVPSSHPRLSNTGISIGYNLNEDIQLIGEIRQEHFYQEFTGSDEEGYEVKYMQSPNLISPGIGLKYDFQKWNNLELFTQTTLSGNSAGVIGRLMLGLEWYPVKGYKFMLGTEGSGFYYQHDKSVFNSYKIGFTYGLGVEF
jgi:hypothetical protein